jgi:hypothetical protein
MTMAATTHTAGACAQHLRARLIFIAVVSLIWRRAACDGR